MGLSDDSQDWTGVKDLEEDSHRGEGPSYHLLSGGPDVDMTMSLFQPLSLDLHMIQVFLVSISGPLLSEHKLCSFGLIGSVVPMGLGLGGRVTQDKQREPEG